MKLFLFAMLVSLNAFAGFDHSHSQWNALVKKYTKMTGNQTLFNYKALKKNEGELNAYLQQLEAVQNEEFKKFNSDQKLAYWLNAYNAYTIQIILKNYPVKSIKDINGGFFSSGPWKKEFITLLGRKLSLDDIEHGIIRKEFKEPRIHFAVNCASIGCPSLLPESFVAAKLDEQLDKAALNFLTNKSKNYVKGNTLYVSKIFKWYGDDFEEKYGSFKNYVIKTLNLAPGDYEVKYTDYDWDLNE